MRTIQTTHGQLGRIFGFPRALRRLCSCGFKRHAKASFASRRREQADSCRTSETLSRICPSRRTGACASRCLGHESARPSHAGYTAVSPLRYYSADLRTSGEMLLSQGEQLAADRRSLESDEQVRVEQISSETSQFEAEKRRQMEESVHELERVLASQRRVRDQRRQRCARCRTSACTHATHTRTPGPHGGRR